MIWTSAEPVEGIEAGRCRSLSKQNSLWQQGEQCLVRPKEPVTGITPEEFILASENFYFNPVDIMGGEQAWEMNLKSN